MNPLQIGELAHWGSVLVYIYLRHASRWTTASSYVICCVLLVFIKVPDFDEECHRLSIDSRISVSSSVREQMHCKRGSRTASCQPTAPDSRMVVWESI